MRFVSLILFLCLSSQIYGQQTFGTKTGRIVLSGTFHGEPFTVVSDALVILLNLETGELQMSIDVLKLKKTKIFQPDFTGFSDTRVSYSGRLSSAAEDLRTQEPTPLEVQGKLTILNNDYTLAGSGDLIFLSGAGSFNYVMELLFYIDVEELGISENTSAWSDQIQVEVLHTILNSTRN